jgi:hypothetical protein
MQWRLGPDLWKSVLVHAQSGSYAVRLNCDLCIYPVYQMEQGNYANFLWRESPVLIGRLAILIGVWGLTALGGG